jgi:hypothetical protein
VRKHRIILGAIAGSAVLVPIVGVTALTAAPAGAAPTGINCSKLTGTANTTTGVVKTKLSTCTGNTGGSGKSTGTTTETSGTVKWINGKSTTATESATAGSGCTGTGAVTEVISGSVTADTTGSTTIGAALSATVCAVPEATNPAILKLSLLPHTKFAFAA